MKLSGWLCKIPREELFRCSSCQISFVWWRPTAAQVCNFTYSPTRYTIEGSVDLEVYKHMKIKDALLLGCAGLIAAALPLLAHHSFAAEYDNTKPVAIKGKVVKMDWVNPHSHLQLEVTKEDGKTELWTAETPPPNGL